MEKEGLEFLTKMLEAMEKKDESRDKKDERRHTEILKLTEQTDKNLEMTREFIEKDLKTTKSIEREVKTTRMMIHTKYHLFGVMMSVLMSMMASLLTISIIEPWKLPPAIQTSASLFIMLLILFISLGIWWRWGKEIFFQESTIN